MPVRLVITTYAKPGKGAELAQAMADRCRAVQQEPGCQQFEVFQSALDPDKLVTLELWDDQAALDTHAQRNATRPPHPGGLPLQPHEVAPRVPARHSRAICCAPCGLQAHGAPPAHQRRQRACPARGHGIRDGAQGLSVAC